MPIPHCGQSGQDGKWNMPMTGGKPSHHIFIEEQRRLKMGEARRRKMLNLPIRKDRTLVPEKNISPKRITPAYFELLLAGLFSGMKIPRKLF